MLQRPSWRGDLGVDRANLDGYGALLLAVVHVRSETHDGH